MAAGIKLPGTMQPQIDNSAVTSSAWGHATESAKTNATRCFRISATKAGSRKL